MTPNDPLSALLSASTPPEDIVAAVAADCEVVHTPCGDGNLVWRRWGSGRSIILVHGGSGSWTHWIKQIPVLKQRYEVWAVDMPGLGDSDMPPHPQIPASCGTVLALGIKALVSREARAHVVAFSFGAHVSTHALVHRGLLEVLMFKEPSRIDALAVHLQAANIRRARFRSRPFARVPEIAQYLPEVRVPISRPLAGLAQAVDVKPALEQIGHGNGLR